MSNQPTPTGIVAHEGNEVSEALVLRSPMPQAERQRLENERIVNRTRLITEIKSNLALLPKAIFSTMATFHPLPGTTSGGARTINMDTLTNGAAQETTHYVHTIDWPNDDRYNQGSTALLNSAQAQAYSRVLQAIREYREACEVFDHGRASQLSHYGENSGVKTIECEGIKNALLGDPNTLVKDETTIEFNIRFLPRDGANGDYLYSGPDNKYGYDIHTNKPYMISRTFQLRKIAHDSR